MNCASISTDSVAGLGTLLEVPEKLHFLALAVGKVAFTIPFMCAVLMLAQFAYLLRQCKLHGFETLVDESLKPENTVYVTMFFTMVYGVLVMLWVSRAQGG